MTNTHATFPMKTVSFFAAVVIWLLLPMTGMAQTTWTTSGNDINNTNSGNVIINGNVGLGQSSPTGKLVVPSGSIFGMGTNSLATWSGHSSVLESANNSIFFGSITDLHMISNATNPVNWKYKTTGPAADYYLYNGYHAWRVATSGTAGTSLTWTNAMTLTNAGNLGIGTATPLQRLQIGANTTTATATPDSISLGATYSNTAGTNAKLRLFDDNAGAVYGLGVSLGQFDFIASSTARYVWNIGGVEKMRLATNGNVGIGTTAPGQPLDVNGNIKGTGFCLGADCRTTWAAIGGSGGTITGITTGSGSGLSGGGTTGSLTLINTDPGSAQQFFKTISNGATQISANANNDTLTVVGAGGTTVSLSNKTITIDGSTSNISAAKVTSGTFGSGNYTFPGDVTVNGNIAAKYQDVAEWVESSQDLTAGTVVVLDSSKNNQVIASTQTYDSRVAGVISAQPGIKLGQEGEGRVLVATTGRVKVRVDASNGPIQIGDLLVTGEKPGFAMKSVPVNIGGVQIHRPGTLIGKALEPLASGLGEILVLLSLQ